MPRGAHSFVKAAWSPSAVPFVGRGAELSLLLAVLAEAGRGQPRTVFIEGDAGVGKSRLVHEVLAAADAAGWLLAGGTCHDDRPLPYLPLRNALASLPERWAAELLPLLEPTDPVPPGGTMERPRTQLEIFAPVARAVVALASERPVLIALEDLHWADPATVDLLTYLVAEAEQRAFTQPTNLLVIVSARPTQRPARIAQLLRERGSSHLVLHGLDELEVNALLAAVAPAPPERRLLGRLHEATDGNPLLLLSLLHRLADEGQLVVRGGELVSLAGEDPFQLPTDLDHELEAQLSRVGSPCRAMLVTAAVLGDGRTLEHLSAVVPSAGATERDLDDLLDEAEGAGLITDDGTSYRFAHPQLRQLLASSVSGRRRQQLHARIADGLEAHLGPSATDEAVSIADHLRRAGSRASRERLRYWNELAGHQAFALAAWSEAATCYDTAIKCLDGRPELALRMRAAQAHFRDHDLAGCRSALTAVLEAATEEDAVSVRADAALMLVQANLTLNTHMPGRRPDTRPLTDLLDALGEHEPLLRARAHAQLSECCFSDFDVAAGLEHARKALALAGAGGDHALGSEVEFAVGLQQLAALDLEDSSESFQRSIDHARALPDPWPSAWGLGRLPGVRLLQGRPDDAVQLAEQALELTGSHADWAEHSLAAAYLVVARLFEGQFDQAERDARLSTLAYRRSDYGFTPTVLYPALAAVRASRRDHPRALEALDDWQVAAGRGTYPFRVAVEAVAGDHASLLRLLEDRPWRSVRGDDTLFTLGLVGLQVEVADALGDAELAAASVRGLRAAFERGVVMTPGWPLLVPRLLGLAHLLAGEGDEAGVWLQQAAELARKAPLPLELAAVRFAKARLLLAASAPERGRAAQLLDEAVVVTDQLGALALARRIRDLADREHLALPSAAATRTTRVLLCTDLVGSTELNARLGDEEYLAVLREHNRLARRALHDHCGVEFKHVGDGIFAWFNSAADAVAAGLAMVASIDRFTALHPDEALHLRVGLAVGQPLADEGDLFGLDVSRTARITATCGGGEVRAEAAVATLTDGAGFEFTHLGAFELKGIPGPVDLFEVTNGAPM